MCIPLLSRNLPSVLALPPILVELNMSTTLWRLALWAWLPRVKLSTRLLGRTHLVCSKLLAALNCLPVSMWWHLVPLLRVLVPVLHIVRLVPFPPVPRRRTWVLVLPTWLPSIVSRLLSRVTWVPQLPCPVRQPRHLLSLWQVPVLVEKTFSVPPPVLTLPMVLSFS